jgi:hypothetical protein
MKKKIEGILVILNAFFKICQKNKNILKEWGTLQKKLKV